MNTKYSVLYVDDDNSAVQAYGDSLTELMAQHELSLFIYTSLESATKGIAEFDAEKWGYPALAVVDIWLFEKSKNTSDPEGGLKLVSLLRKRFEDTYVIIYSAHVGNGSDDPYRKKLEHVPQLAIYKKSETQNNSSIRAFMLEKLKEAGVIK